MGKRRAKRVPCDIAIVLTAQDEYSGKLLAGPLEGRIIDISCYGAGLILSQIMSNSFHLFHTTREQDSSCLQLTVQPSTDKDEFIVHAHPVWMDVHNQDMERAFIMGVEFTIQLDKERLAKILS